jgi:hypothetical protein
MIPDSLECFAAAKNYRNQFWFLSNQIDHRQARCV